VGDVEFEWDEAKRLSNIAKHGIDFQDVRPLFDGRPIAELDSIRGSEQRVVTIGEVAEEIVTVVSTQRGRRRRIISARRASRDERREYRQILRD
jgi:uncharacterized DUF497 family protein